MVSYICESHTALNLKKELSCERLKEKDKDQRKVTRINWNVRMFHNIRHFNNSNGDIYSKQNSTRLRSCTSQSRKENMPNPSSHYALTVHKYFLSLFACSPG